MNPAHSFVGIHMLAVAPIIDQYMYKQLKARRSIQIAMRASRKPSTDHAVHKRVWSCEALPRAVRARSSSISVVSCNISNGIVMMHRKQPQYAVLVRPGRGTDRPCHVLSNL